jgi:hypothetical protein
MKWGQYMGTIKLKKCFGHIHKLFISTFRENKGPGLTSTVTKDYQDLYSSVAI